MVTPGGRVGGCATRRPIPRGRDLARENLHVAVIWRGRNGGRQRTRLTNPTRGKYSYVKLPCRESAPADADRFDYTLVTTCCIPIETMNYKSGTVDFYMTYNTVVCSHNRLGTKSQNPETKLQSCAYSHLSLISISAQLSHHTPPKQVTSASR